ncbi:hypothetical protein [Sphingomonas adhaesiva]|uniref:hypothetical protein n=1 Tax=Sphingomonas adhaesiva TaxID=28212 RepID=UPI002FF58196
MSSKGRSKKPAAAFKPAIGKSIRGTAGADTIATMPFKWTSNGIDLDGPYGWKNLTAEVLLCSIIPKLHDFEKMTWGEIDGPTGSHFVDVTAITKDARKRLPQIGILDVDQLFSLRITGKSRIWGIRDVAVLRVLWWDPEHLVCPSTLKHT